MAADRIEALEAEVEQKTQDVLAVRAHRPAQRRIRELEEQLAALAGFTSEFDEETGYCLCVCCRHGI